MEPSFVVLYWSREKGRQQVVWEGRIKCRLRVYVLTYIFI